MYLDVLYLTGACGRLFRMSKLYLILPLKLFFNLRGEERSRGRRGGKDQAARSRKHPNYL